MKSTEVSEDIDNIVWGYLRKTQKLRNEDKKTAEAGDRIIQKMINARFSLKLRGERLNFQKVLGIIRQPAPWIRCYTQEGERVNEEGNRERWIRTTLHPPGNPEPVIKPLKKARYYDIPFLRECYKEARQDDTFDIFLPRPRNQRAEFKFISLKLHYRKNYATHWEKQKKRWSEKEIVALQFLEKFLHFLKFKCPTPKPPSDQLSAEECLVIWGKAGIPTVRGIITFQDFYNENFRQAVTNFRHTRALYSLLRFGLNKMPSQNLRKRLVDPKITGKKTLKRKRQNLLKQVGLRGNICFLCSPWGESGRKGT